MPIALAGIVVAAIASLAAGCATRAVLLPDGPGASIPHDHVLLIGKVELRSDRNCHDLSRQEDQESCRKSSKSPQRADLDLGGTGGKLVLDRVHSWIDSIPIKFNEYFFVVVRRASGYSLRGLVLPDYFKAHVVGFFGSYNHSTISCDSGFAVPPDARVAYVGTIVIYHSMQAGQPQFILSVDDAFDEAREFLRRRNPDLRDNIFKTLFRELLGYPLQLSDLPARNVACWRPSLGP